MRHEAQHCAMSTTMQAMVFDAPGCKLKPGELKMPEPSRHQLRLRVLSCGVCRTDLHVVDGELTGPKLPLILGHEIVGTVVSAGDGARQPRGALVGVPWLGETCGACRYCETDRENLCERAIFTGYQRDGGYAEYT